MNSRISIVTTAKHLPISDKYQPVISIIVDADVVADHVTPFFSDGTCKSFKTRQEAMRQGRLVMCLDYFRVWQSMGTRISLEISHRLWHDSIASVGGGLSDSDYWQYVQRKTKL